MLPNPAEQKQKKKKEAKFIDFLISSERQSAPVGGAVVSYIVERSP
jgi:hypothetical protein